MQGFVGCGKAAECAGRTGSLASLWEQAEDRVGGLKEGGLQRDHAIRGLLSTWILVSRYGLCVVAK